MTTVVCKQCQHFGRPKKRKRGSDGLAMASWLVFPLGLPYTFWRMLTRYPVCSQCGSGDIHDVESKIGSLMMDNIFGVADVTLDEKLPKKPKAMISPKSEQELFEEFIETAPDHAVLKTNDQPSPPPSRDPEDW